MARLAAACSALLAAGCATPWGGTPTLRSGLRVEVESRVAEPARALEVDQKEDEPGLDVTAPIARAQDGTPLLLQVPVRLSSGIEYEDATKQPIAPFELVDGLWVRARGEERDGLFHVRKLRLAEPRERIEVEGVVTDIERVADGRARALRMEPFRFELTPDTDVTLLDAAAQWRAFLEVGPLGRRASKEEKFVPLTIPLGERMRLGGQLSAEVEREVDLDLDRDRRRDKTITQGSLELVGVARLGDEAFAFASLEQRLRFEEIEERENRQDGDLELGEAYLFLPDVGVDGLHLQLGRQDFDERREWLYDEALDGARAQLELAALQLELSVSETPRLLAPDETTLRNWIGMATYAATDDWSLAAYAIDRQTRRVDEFSPLHFGLRSYVRPDPGFSHWLELSRVDGLVEGRRLRGHALDAGVTWVGEAEWEPSVTLGWALGSGDDSPDRTDRAFRQTGLHDNNGKWNGVTSFRYYGEAFDPELSNLRVTTLGVGVRPLRTLSIDLIGHLYRQDVATAQLLLAEIDEATSGLSTDLGRELDLVVGWRGAAATAELVLAVFDPGNAIPKDDLAWFASVQVRFKF